MNNITRDAVCTHQNRYVKDLREIPTSKLDMSDLDKELDEETHQLFWPLQGGLAWLLMTRADICPFIGYLQRAVQKPLIRHAELIIGFFATADVFPLDSFSRN